MDSYDVCVRGAGSVGCSLALSLARQGLRVALQGRSRESGAADVRAFALNAASHALLDDLRVWHDLESAATPVHDMRVEGDAPGHALEFSSWQQRRDALAWIVDAAALEESLAAATRYSPHITRLAPEVSVQAALTAHCEGRDSPGRERMRVAFGKVDYGQRAIAARLVSDAPHRHVARQWFRSPDVLALLPFDRPEADHSHALVWSVPEARGQALMVASTEEFEAQLHEATGGVCGRLRLADAQGMGRASWPLAVARAEHWSGPGWVLLGDAAHLVHPLAGQGLNLGLADVVVLSKVLAAREPWRPLGDERLLRRYERERLGPTWAMATMTDGLLRLFSSSHAPVRELRNRGLDLVNHLAPVKRWLTDRATGL